ncbi:unnamed protein product [Owenia fusiformis]|uniref:Sm domain-containing protein n=1 Tax=Owenia fusiformis TaxID=6347 RepID=A0A8S4N1G3_OWEFU|nr:unnamed protein product [Owenia fusiformis]
MFSVEKQREHLDCTMAGEFPGSEDQTSDRAEKMKKLEGWLNKTMKIKMTDGRTLIGVFLCTDKDKNVILGSCQEYLHSPDEESVDKKEEPRTLGLSMIPGRHIVSIDIDDITTSTLSNSFNSTES